MMLARQAGLVMGVALPLTLIGCGESGGGAESGANGGGGGTAASAGSSSSGAGGRTVGGAASGAGGGSDGSEIAVEKLPCTADACEYFNGATTDGCTYELFRGTRQIQERAVASSGAASLWAGAALRDEKLTPWGIDRAPLELSLKLGGGGDPLVGELRFPDREGYTLAVEDILFANDPAPRAASAELRVDRMQDDELFDLLTGLSRTSAPFDSMIEDVDFFEMRTGSVALVQVTYTDFVAEVKLPHNEAELSVQGADDPALSPSTRPTKPLFIDRVTHGDRVVFAVLASGPFEPLRAAMEHIFNALLDGSEGSLSEADLRWLGDVAILGIRQGETSPSRPKTLEELKTYLRPARTFSSTDYGPPLSYHLTDLMGATQAQTVSATFMEPHCEGTEYAFALTLVNLEQLTPDGALPEGLEGSISIGYDATNSTPDGCPNTYSVAAPFTTPVAPGSTVVKQNNRRFDVPEDYICIAANVSIAIDGFSHTYAKGVLNLPFGSTWSHAGSFTLSEGDATLRLSYDLHTRPPTE